MSSASTLPERTERRGAARRRALLEATVRVIGRGGIAAVDHRAVAAEADVPLGSTTYYFASKDDMVAQALHHVAEREVERLEAEAGGGLFEGDDASLVERLADLVLDTWANDRTVLLAQFELYLEAGRREDLRPAAQRWDRSYRHLLERVLDRLGAPDPAGRARLLCPAIDGLLLQHVATGADAIEVRQRTIETIELMAA